jgi:hypothetical protein
LIRPFARALQRPAVFASSKQVVAPFTPSFNAQLQKKESVVPADKMVGPDLEMGCDGPGEDVEWCSSI